MDPAASHALRRVAQTTLRIAESKKAFPVARWTNQQRWTCSDCRASMGWKRPSNAGRLDDIPRESRRGFFTQRRLRDEERRPPIQPPTSSLPNPTPTTPSPESITPKPALPSTTDSQRSTFTKRLTHLTDSILARASIAGQHINVYTGTDYSGIEALRHEITACESDVRAKHKLVDEAREKYQEAHTKQGAAQKEIVGLLERKSSWSPADLERYMSLVRSEHTNDQAVAAANEGLSAAERDLEDARSLLERLERKQYHEEQIWSDTIRRNSTWVTFGLMGVNIVLVLAQIAVFEPWRRRKIVREVERVVEEKGQRLAAHEGIPAVRAVEVMVDDVVEPAGVTVEALEEDVAPAVLPLEFTPETKVGKTPLAAGEVLPQEAVVPPTTLPSEAPKSPRPDTWAALWDSYIESFQDLFSERVVEMKKVDVTTVALQGAATGVATMGLLFVIFRPS